MTKYYKVNVYVKKNNIEEKIGEALIKNRLTVAKDLKTGKKYRICNDYQISNKNNCLNDSVNADKLVYYDFDNNTLVYYGKSDNEFDEEELDEDYDDLYDLLEDDVYDEDEQYNQYIPEMNCARISAPYVKRSEINKSNTVYEPSIFDTLEYEKDLDQITSDNMNEERTKVLPKKNKSLIKTIKNRLNKE